VRDLSAEAAAAADEAISRSDASLQTFVQALLRQSRVQTYGLSRVEAALYLNMNTPSDIPATAFSSSSTLS